MVTYPHFNDLLPPDESPEDEEALEDGVTALGAERRWPLPGPAAASGEAAAAAAAVEVAEEALLPEEEAEAAAAEEEAVNRGACSAEDVARCGRLRSCCPCP